MPTSSFSLFVFLLSCNLLPLVRAATTTACPGDCSGHGMCNSATTHCDCYAGYMGHACDLRACPTGIRWIGMASGTDTLHETLVECSGVGKCDRRSGLCKCSLPYSGRGCERVGCPDTSTGLTPCNGNGMCVSLKQLASIKDDIHFFNTYTYNSLWDAEKLWGCVCDYGYTGNDCSQRTCPMGDDPLATSGSATVDSQRYTCAGTSGYFVAKIFGFVTEQIAYNANAATVKAALEALPPIRGVSVSFSSGSVVCASGTITTTIQWTHTPGDVPQLSFPVNTANIAYASLSVDGTSTSEECSGRGLCTRTGANQGLCTCETGFSSSNGASTNTAGGENVLFSLSFFFFLFSVPFFSVPLFLLLLAADITSFCLSLFTLYSFTLSLSLFPSFQMLAIAPASRQRPRRARWAPAPMERRSAVVTVCAPVQVLDRRLTAAALAPMNGLATAAVSANARWERRGGTNRHQMTSRTIGPSAQIVDSVIVRLGCANVLVATRVQPASSRSVPSLAVMAFATVKAGA